jgi:pimeloyl-ACP methyl ester carboxylesterase
MGAYRFAGRDGVQLACREAGSGRPLVLLHGLMGAGSHMLDYGRASAFAEQGYRVIVPDFRGHGDSASLRPNRRAWLRMTLLSRQPSWLPARS